MSSAITARARAALLEVATPFVFVAAVGPWEVAGVLSPAPLSASCNASAVAPPSVSHALALAATAPPGVHVVSSIRAPGTRRQEWLAACQARPRAVVPNIVNWHIDVDDDRISG